MKVYTRDLEKLLVGDVSKENVKALTAYTKMFNAIQKDSFSLQVKLVFFINFQNTKLIIDILFFNWKLQNQLEDKEEALEDADKARAVAMKKLPIWEAELQKFKQEMWALNSSLTNWQLVIQTVRLSAVCLH